MNLILHPSATQTDVGAAFSLYEYVMALTQRAMKSGMPEIEAALLQLKIKIVQQAKEFGHAWTAWANYWQEAGELNQKISQQLSVPRV